MPPEGETLARIGMVKVLPRLKPLSAADFLKLDLPPRVMVLDPVLPTQGIAMIHAGRGIGKTHLALSISYTAFSGGLLPRRAA
jgi:hypothetical protein